jgi:hypothetical protein
MARRSIDEIDQMRRDAELSWEEYALMLSKRPSEDWKILLGDFARGRRDRKGRLRDLEDLGIQKKN